MARWSTDHPLVTVALVSGLVAIGHAVWIWSHRRVGAYDPDEAGYLANAFRFQRSIDPVRPWLAIREIATTGTGPVVPMLSTAALLIGPNDPRTAMMVQPVLMVVCSVAITGMARRFTAPGPAIVAGIAFCSAPTVGLATQSYWLGLGAATFAALAAWALLSSDRLRNRWWIVYGAALGTMILTRTMALAFVPGLALAGVVVAGRDRTAWRHLLGAGAVCLGIALPFWVINWTGLTEYLLSYGYGERAGLFGSGTVLDRFGFRMDRMLNGTLVAYMLPVLLVSLTTAGVAAALRLRRNGVPTVAREGAALGVAVAAGMAALVSTSNNGVWFELPLIVLALPLLAWALSYAWRPLRIVVALAVVAAAVSTLLRSWWIIPPDTRWPPDAAHYEYGFAQYDPRFGPDRRDELPAAAADWRQANERVARLLGDIAEETDGSLFVMSGNRQLTNSNSVGLAAELLGRPLVITIPDTTVGMDDLERELEPFPLGPDGSGTEKVLVIARHDQILFTPDAGVDRFDRAASERGWNQVAAIALPDGGEVAVLRHPGR